MSSCLALKTPPGPQPLFNLTLISYFSNPLTVVDRGGRTTNPGQCLSSTGSVISTSLVQMPSTKGNCSLQPLTAGSDIIAPPSYRLSLDLCMEICRTDLDKNTAERMQAYREAFWYQMKVLHLTQKHWQPRCVYSQQVVLHTYHLLFNHSIDATILLVDFFVHNTRTVSFIVSVALHISSTTVLTESQD